MYLQGNPILWDNWVVGFSGNFAAQDDPPGTPDRIDAFPADDFMFDENTDVHAVYWHMAYTNCNNANGPMDYKFDWNITFFEDDGTGYHPGEIYVGPITISDIDIIKGPAYRNDSSSNGLWGCPMLTQLPEMVTFDADTKYWISIYSIGAHFPQSTWMAHSEAFGGIRLNEANWKSEYFGFPEWVNASEQFGNTNDMNFLLLNGDPAYEVTFSKGLGVTANITNLIAPYDTTNVTITFTATGGFVLNRELTVLVGDLEPGASGSAKYVPLGFGNIVIDVTIISNEGAPGWGDTTGFLILFFVL